MKKVLWLTLILLTVTIFLFRVNLVFSMGAAQSTQIFQSLPWFAVLFITWLVNLAWLFILNKNAWLRAILVGIFSLVFLGFWIAITPLGTLHDYDGGGISYAQFIRNYWTFSSSFRNFGYLQFPFTSILGAGISKITTLNIFNTRTVILLFNSVVIGVCCFIFFKNMLKNTTLAVIGAGFAILGNMTLCDSIVFSPASEGLVLFVMFLALVIKGNGVIFASKWDKIIAVVLIVAITITHCITGFYVIAVLLGIILVQLFTKKKLMNLWFVAPLVVIPLIWNLTMASTMSYDILRLSTQSAKFVISYTSAITANGASAFVPSATIPPVGTSSNPFSLWWVKDMAVTYLGGQSPLWMRAIIIFWVLALFIFGSILALVNLVRIRKLSNNLQILTGAMLGVFGLSILAVFTSLNTGGFQFFRYLDFSGFFLVPIILLFIQTLNYRKVALIVLAVLIVVLSFPTFLAYNSIIEGNAVYPQEIQAGQYLQTIYGDGSGLKIYTDGETATVLMCYLPNATYYYIDELSISENKDVILQQVGQLLSDFNKEQGNKLFVLSPKFEWFFVHQLSISVNNPEWAKLQTNFINDTEMYDNGFVQVYN